MNLGAVFVTGLLAGGASCSAVQGGLLTALVARRDLTPAAPASRTSGLEASPKDPPGPRPAAVRDQLAADLAPVGGFLAGKLVAHTLLGAALGLVGSAFQPTYQARAAAQTGAGLLMLALAAAQLRVPGFARFTITPPSALGRLVRGRAKAQSALAPAMLGVATLLIPCGVTVAMELLAATSGSPTSGAAIMATFVIGTSPLFGALGYLARKSATALKGQLAMAAAVVVAVMGLVSLNAGLVVAGSPLTVSSALHAVGGTSSGPADASTVTVADGRQRILIEAKPTAYVPSRLAARAGLPTTLVLRTNELRVGCTRAFVLRSHGIEVVLPATGERSFDLGVLDPGTIPFACGMGMYRGSITVT